MKPIDPHNTSGFDLPSPPDQKFFSIEVPMDTEETPRRVGEFTQARNDIDELFARVAKLEEAQIGGVTAGDDILFNPTDDISEKQALEAALAQKAEELAIANARIAELEARVEAPAAADWPDLNDKLSDWDEVGHGAIASNIPAGIAELMEPGETLTHDVRRKLTERLNVELAELKNLRGLAGEDLKREAEIEKLLGLFARLGEI